MIANQVLSELFKSNLLIKKQITKEKEQGINPLDLYLQIKKNNEKIDEILELNDSESYNLEIYL